MPVAIDTPSSRPPIVKPNITAGQTEPTLSLIQPYEAFPKQVTGRTVWKREQFISAPDVWQHHWTPRQLGLLDKAYDDFAASGKDLTEINKVGRPCTVHTVAKGPVHIHIARGDP